MTEKLYYWAENLEGYSSDSIKYYEKTIEIKRLSFFIGKNNAGKSRFLRNLFNSKFTFHETNSINIINTLKELNSELKKIFEKNDFLHTIPANNGMASIHKSALLSKIQTFLDKSFYPTKEYSTESHNLLIQLSNYYLKSDPNFFNNFLSKENIIDAAFGNITLFQLKKYIPILRGMRPLTESINKNPYIERTQKDYFSDSQKYNSSNIITGESLYHELKIYLLGEPEQREIIKQYEEKLSQYFFDNEPITLIPKHDQDVVNIKIGGEAQFPISQLGDGLQQVIILTYEAFIKKDEIHAFFIEEPELHMHAGMVRQLMNFYLNETDHYYFFTTHSNHLLDMADESDQVIIQKFVKQPKENPKDGFDFKIYRCDRDRDLLASLGVKPSSVYLANCTIWVEGITDRLYITKYMEKYLAELETTDAEQYKKYRRFMPNYHYTFVEYAGSNLVHWSFNDDYADHLDDKGLSAKAVASEMLLIADGDIQSKADRVEILQSELNAENYFILPCKETENTLPFDVIIRVATNRFERMNIETKDGYNIELMNNISDKSYFDNTEFGIGRLLDEAIKIPNQNPSKNPFADGTGVGTIKKKLDFCREIIKDFDENPDWQLTSKAQELCERIFQHIEKCNR